MFFKTKAIFFDIGGVVVDANLQSYADMGAKMFQTDPENIRKAASHLVPDFECGRMSSHNFWKLIETSLWSLGVGKPDKDSDLDAVWRDLLKESIEVNFEVVKIAEELREKYTVGVLSNAIKDHVTLMNDLKVYQGFDPVVVSCLEGMRKPDRPIYKLAAKKAGVWARQCYFIDDMPENIEAAKKAGMKTHLFKDAPTLRRALKDAKLL